MMMRIFLIVFFLFIFQLPTVGQPAGVEALLRREMRERRIPGLQVAVVQNQRIVLLQSFGTADLQHSVPLQTKQLSRSIPAPKRSRALQIMQLVEEGKVDLNAPSVAEAYAANGERELAIKNYKRSLELDPKNLNAVQQLKKLEPMK